MKTMTKFYHCLLLCLIALNACNEKGEPAPSIVQVKNPDASVCLDTASLLPRQPAIHVKSVKDTLQLTLLNYFISCPADTIPADVSKENQVLDFIIKEPHPESSCICPKNLTFKIYPISEDTYTLNLFKSTLGSVNKLNSIRLLYDETLDYTFDLYTGTDLLYQYQETKYGGCNNYNELKSNYLPETGKDSVNYTLTGDTIDIFTGFNHICCAPFATDQFVHDNTLYITITDTCPDPPLCYCRCDCYYTFNTIYTYNGPDDPDLSYQVWLSELYSGKQTYLGGGRVE
jgi:hypothetical protein